MHERTLSALPTCVSPGQDAGGEDGANFVVTVKAETWSRRGRRAGVTLERGERESWRVGGTHGDVSTLRERMFFACGSSRTTAEEGRGTELLWIFLAFYFLSVPSSFSLCPCSCPLFPFSLFPLTSKGSFSKRFHPVSSLLRGQ